MGHILLPGPGAVAKGLVATLSEGSVIHDIMVSLVDLLLGLGVSLIIGLGGGIVIGRYQKVEAILDPYVSFMNATPTVALIPVVIVWFGVATEARVVFIVLISVWSILVNTVAGIKATQKGHVEVGQSFGLSELQMLWVISLPAAAPYIFAGIRVALGRAFVGMIVGEMEMQYAGLGGLLATLGGDFKTAQLLAMVFVTSVFGAAVVLGFSAYQRRRFAWI
ncbi:MAG: ABC transporter permease, partial [Chloroflexota bacterium]